MQYDVTIDFGNDESYTYPVAAEPTPEATAQAQAWLDAQFIELGCEPLRPSGKVLNADKALAVAIEAGAKRFRERPDWAVDYALATALALNRAVVRVNVRDRIVGY